MKIFAQLYLALLLLSCTQAEKTPEMNSQNTTAHKKVIIYQMMTRLFGNTMSANITYGTKEQNGVGKFNDINDKALLSLRELGITHIWYTGVIEHAIIGDYSEYGIAIDDADVVKGRAGSPYAIKDYYDVNPDLAEDIPNRLREFKALIKRTHEQGMKVIIDFVPNHVARRYVSDAKPEGVVDFGSDDDTSIAFSPQNNFYYLPGKPFQVPPDYEPIPGFQFITKNGSFDENPGKATGNDKFVPDPDVGDWFETVKLNYGVDYDNERTRHFTPRPDTWDKMKDILAYWAAMGVDGFRCDMAEMVPVEFWGWVIPEIQQINPNIKFIAEIYNPNEYENYLQNGKFDFLYDKVELYDTLRHIIEGHGNTDNISPIVRNFEEKSIDAHMLRFMENHDEQRLASRFFAGDPWKGWPAVVLSATISNDPMMIYFGQEVGEPGEGQEGFQGDDGRTTIFDYWGVPQHQKWMNGGLFDGGKLSEDQKIVRTDYSKLLNLCNDNEALQHGDVIDLHAYNLAEKDGYKNSSVYSFAKSTANKHLLIICNFHSQQGAELKIKLPEKLREIEWEHSKDILTGQSLQMVKAKGGKLGLNLKPHQALILQPRK